MFNLLFLSAIVTVLIYRCYKLEKQLTQVIDKHNDLVEAVNNNAIILNYLLKEKGEDYGE